MANKYPPWGPMLWRWDEPFTPSQERWVAKQFQAAFRRGSDEPVVIYGLIRRPGRRSGPGPGEPRPPSG